MKKHCQHVVHIEWTEDKVIHHYCKKPPRYKILGAAGNEDAPLCREHGKYYKTFRLPIVCIHKK